MASPPTKVQNHIKNAFEVNTSINMFPTMGYKEEQSGIIKPKPIHPSNGQQSSTNKPMISLRVKDENSKAQRIGKFGYI